MAALAIVGVGVAVGSGCGPFCREGTLNQRVATWSATGSVTGPPALGFNRPVQTATCSDVVSSVEACIVRPAACTTATFELVVAAADGPSTSATAFLRLPMVLSGLPYPGTITLPDPRVTSPAEILSGPSSTPMAIQLTGGSLTVELRQDHFEAHLVADLVTGDGTPLQVSDGSCTDDDRIETSCVAD
jgi:hypothetical protein